METLLHADVFFFVTTVAVVFVTTALAIVLIYIVQILGDMRKVVRRLKEESELIVDDVHYVRTTVREKALNLVDILGTVAGWVSRDKKLKKRSKKKVVKGKTESKS